MPVKLHSRECLRLAIWVGSHMLAILGGKMLDGLKGEGLAAPS